MKRIRLIFIFMMMFLFACFFVGCGNENTENKEQEQKEQEKPEDTKKEITFNGEKELELFEESDAEINVKLLINNEEVNLFDNVNFVIDDEDVIEIKDNKICGKKIGETTLKVVYKENKAKYFTIEITVKENEGDEPQDEPITITFPEFTEEIIVGEYEELVLDYSCDGDVKVEVTSSNEETIVIREVEGKYQVCGMNKGNCKVNVKLSSASDVKEKEYTIFVMSNSPRINYVLDGGTLPENAPTKYEEGATTYLVNPTKDGYTFVGWCLNQISSNYIDSITPEITGEITVYAIWR